MFDRTVEQAINQSVQTADVNTAKKPMTVDGAWDFWGVIPHAEIISAWGNRRRDRELRTLSYAVHNGLFQGAIAGLIMRWQSVPYEIKGGRNLVRFYQDMLAANWEEWIAQLAWDFLTQDFGGVTEIIGGGRADKPLTGRVLGLSHMDSLSCWATKSAEYPVIYWNEETGAMHQMHATRVHRFTDMVSPKRTAYGNGFCALSRYLSESNVDILLGRHDNEMLNDLPPAGLLSVSGMTKDQWDDSTAMFETNRRADGQSVFRGTMVLHAIDPTNPLKIESIPFSTLPEGFDTAKFVQTHVNKLALALGVDPQDIWPLSGQALGTGTQSTILNAKARGKMFGRFLQMVTRFINYKVLPDGLEFQFKFKDTEEDAESANTAKTWVDIANTAAFLSDEEKRQLVAQQVEAIRDVITDENGEIVALPDDDPKDQDQEIIVPDDTPLAPAGVQPPVPANLQSTDTPPAVQAATEDERPVAGQRDLRRDNLHLSRKAYADTRDTFVGDVAANISDAANGTITPGAFAIRMRAAIAKYGKAAYLDGLAEGGVEVDAIPTEDSDAYAALLAEQSGYVTDARSGITDFKGDAESRAQMWGNKTLQLFFDAGRMSSDKNGMYEWEYGDTEHCDDCLRLNGQKHRLKEWQAKGWMPKVSKLECKGYRCQCELKKTTGRAKGSY